MSNLVSFAVGDVVRLKSGGPVMTVCAVPEQSAFTWLADGKLQVVNVNKSYAGTVWFSGGELRRDFVPTDSLEKYERKEFAKLLAANKLRNAGEISQNCLDRDHS